MQKHRIATLEAENAALKEKLERAEKVVEAAWDWRTFRVLPLANGGELALDAALRAYKEV